MKDISHKSTRHAYKGILLGVIALLAIGAHAQTAAPSDTTMNGKDEPVKLSPFQVSAKGDDGYGSANTVGATRINTAIIDTPLSVAVINHQLIEDLAATQPYEALRFVSGVSGAGAPYSGQLTLRGRNLPGTTYRDGVPDLASVGGAEMIDLAFTDRIEAIKGPAGTLYGISSSGGVVNTVTKSPLEQSFNSLKLTIGSYNVHRVEIDSTGPLDDSKRWTYRVIAADQSGNTNMGGPDNAIAVAGMARYKFSDGNGNVLFRVSYQDITRATNQYPWFADVNGNISFNLPTTQPITEKDASREHQTTRLDFEASRGFQTGPIDWTARVAARYSYLNNVASRLYEQDDVYYQFFDTHGNSIGNMDTIAFSDPRIADIKITSRTRSTATGHQETGITNIDFVGKGKIGGVDNTFLVYGFTQSLKEIALESSGDYPGIDLYHPVYIGNPNAAASPAIPDKILLTYSTSNAAAFQDNISMLNDKLIVVLGYRYDTKTSSSVDRLNNVKVFNDVRQGGSRKLGVVWRPKEWLGVYYNYSETFNPSTTNQFTGAKYPNLLSQNNEVGFKIAALNNRFILNTAFFSTKTTNVIVQLYNIIGPGGVLLGVNGPAGTLKTDGWESDGTFAISKNLAIIGGFGALNSKTQSGAYARAVPLGLNYKAFAKYSFTNDALKGLFLGYGYEHNSRRGMDGQVDNYFMPEYNTSNALIGYSSRNWKIQANIQNLMSAKYATIAVATSIIYAGAPRNFQITASRSW